MEQIRGSEVVEFMRFGFGWRASYAWDGQKVWLHHKGYVWRIFGILIPVPIGWIIGGGDAWEEPLSDDSFSMWMGVVHPWFGQTYSYGGTFRVKKRDMGKALILGGYGNFGKRIARALVGKGGSVIIAGRSEKKGEAICRVTWVRTLPKRWRWMSVMIWWGNLSASSPLSSSIPVARSKPVTMMSPAPASSIRCII